MMMTTTTTTTTTTKASDDDFPVVHRGYFLHLMVFSGKKHHINQVNAQAHSLCSSLVFGSFWTGNGYIHCRNQIEGASNTHTPMDVCVCICELDIHSLICSLGHTYSVPASEWIRLCNVVWWYLHIFPESWTPYTGLCALDLKWKYRIGQVCRKDFTHVSQPFPCANVKPSRNFTVLDVENWINAKIKRNE